MSDFGTPDLKIDCLFAFVAQGAEGEGIMAANLSPDMMIFDWSGLDENCIFVSNRLPD